MNRIASIIAAGVLAFCSSGVNAAIKVGDQAVLTYQTVDGKTVDIQKLHGKIVLVDFWATWCKPCMGEADHMVAINDKYAGKGLVFLGISLDQDKAKMLAVAKEKKFTWPQYFDGKVWQNDVFGKWGSNAIPLTVLIDPNGKVVYATQPGPELDAAIEATFKATPPFMVDPKIIADASKFLDQAEEKLTANDPKSAMKLLAKVPAVAKGDADFADRQKGVEKKLQDAAESMLAEVDPLVTAGNYPEAIAKLRELSEGLAGTPTGVKAKKELASVLAKPEAKAAIAKAEKDAHEKDAETKSADALAAAMKLQADKKDDQAYIQFKSIATNFPGTAAATTASEQVKTYDAKNPDLAQKANESAVGGKAKAALSVAMNYERIGRFDQAREKYQAVIDTYPGTSYAATAREHLAQLPAAGTPAQ